MLRFVGLFLVLALLFGAVVYSGNPVVFFDPPSFLLVCGGVIGVLIMTQEASTWACVLRLFFGGLPEKDDTQSTLLFLETGSRAAIGFGLMGQLIGFVTMLANLSDPSAIGPAMAVSLLSILYGVGVSEILFAPMMSRLLVGSKVHPGTIRKMGFIYLAVCVVLLLITTFFMFMLSFSNYEFLQ